MTMLEAAQNYISRGLAVLPLHSIKAGRCTCGKADCGSPGKHPRTAHGVADASRDPEQIKKWWGMWPDANIGIATGAASGIVVIDIDGNEGADSLEALIDSLGPLLDSWESLTGGGGRHLIFKAPRGQVYNKVGLAPHVDIRGDGGFIVAPPSMHISGRRYEWEASSDPADTPLADLPPEWVEVLTRGNGSRFTPAEPVAETLPQGSRNDGLFRLGATMRAKGLSDAAILAALQEENKRRCDPPLHKAEVEAIADSVAKYEQGPLPAMPAPAINGPAKLQEVESKLPVEDTNVFYSDEMVAIAVELEEAHSPDLFKMRQILLAQKGFKARQFDKAVSMFKRRKLGLKVVADGDTADLLDLSQLIPGEEILAGLKMPAGWQLENGQQIFRGRLNAKEELIKEVACPHLIFPVERLQNVETGTEKIKLSFYRDGRWSSVIVDRSTIAMRAGMGVLADTGIQVTSESAKHLIAFLSDFETANAKLLPVSKSLSRAGWLNLKQFAPYDTELVFDGDLSFKAAYSAITESGDFDLWKAAIGTARSSVKIRTLIAASFAAPLLWILDGQSFFVHLWGTRSGIGKTVALKAALSAWGNPSKLWRSFNSTNVGLEYTAGFFHSPPVGIDELQTASNNLKDKNGGVRGLVYALTQGQGKGRGRKSGGVEAPLSWNTIFLTTGEQPVTEIHSTEGALARVIEVILNEGDYPEALPPTSLIAAVSDDYGHAGQQFIGKLISWLDGSRSPLSDLHKQIMAALADENYSSKYIQALTYLAMGDMLMSMFVYDADPDEALADALAFACEVLMTLSKKTETDPGVHVNDWLFGWIAENSIHFNPQMENVTKYGRITADLGYGKEGFIIKSVFDAALRDAGFNAKAAIKGLVDAGVFLPSKEAASSQPKWIGAATVRCYVINPDLISPES